jgi:RimJ/RimL family protein N-acetyltransferase
MDSNKTASANTFTLVDITPADINEILDYYYNPTPSTLESIGVKAFNLPPIQHYTDWLIKCATDNDQEKTAYICLIKLEEINIGHVVLGHLQFGKEAVFHIHLWKEQHRKMGAGKSIFPQIIQIAFTRFALQRLIIDVPTTNIAAQKLIGKFARLTAEQIVFGEKSLVAGKKAYRYLIEADAINKYLNNITNY